MTKIWTRWSARERAYDHDHDYANLGASSEDDVCTVTERMYSQIAAIAASMGACRPPRKVKVLVTLVKALGKEQDVSDASTTETPFPIQLIGRAPASPGPASRAAEAPAAPSPRSADAFGCCFRRPGRRTRRRRPRCKQTAARLASRQRGGLRRPFGLPYAIQTSRRGSGGDVDHTEKQGGPAGGQETGFAAPDRAAGRRYLPLPTCRPDCLLPGHVKGGHRPGARRHLWSVPGPPPSPPGRRLFHCQQCSYATPFSSHLKAHRRLHTGERPYQCSHCGRAFAEKGNLVTHLRTHTGERPFRCHLCPMDFAVRATLDSHVRTHTGVRPFRCRFCPEAFKYRLQQKKHEEKEHGQRHLLDDLIAVHFIYTEHGEQCRGPSPSPLSVGGQRQQHGPLQGWQRLRCHQCSYMAPSPSQLKIHQRKHTGERPHQCQYCFKAFGQRCSLVTHLRIHTGERPHQCSHCSKAFVQKRHLVNHLRVHTGERPFRCHLCPMDFAVKDTLDSHVRTHTGERPFRCCFCPHAFTHRPQLRKHKEHNHCQ
ncbi:uncharacterized protein LOC144178768 [Haemaphysalis longicornis]